MVTLVATNDATDVREWIMALEGVAGAWRLKTAHFEMADTGEVDDMFGPDPRGWLLISESGRMAVLITTSDRQDGDGPETLFRTMLSYTAVVTVAEPGTLVFTVDAAWQPSWVGTRQVRHYEVNGDVLKIRSAKQTHPRHGDRLLYGYGVLEWTR